MSKAIFLAGSILALALPLSAVAAPTYSPAEVDLNLSPGESASFSYTVSEDGANAIAPYVSYADGGLPIDWLGSIPTAWYWFTDSASTQVTVTVPADAEPGLYSGTLFGSSWGGAHGFDGGPGVALEIRVGSDCAGLTEFIAGSENDIELWAPNNTLRSIELLGEIRMQAGCSILAANYKVDDEYGEYSGSGVLEITGDDSGYRATPLLEVSRHGNDKDGRNYTVTLSIETEAGVATLTRSVVILHDQRDKAGKNK